MQAWTFAFVALFGGTVTAQHATLRAIVIVGVFVPLVAWAVLRLRGPRDGIDMAILVGLAAHAAVALASLDAQGSLEALGAAIGFALLFWFMRQVGASPHNRRLVAISACGAITFWLVLTAFAWIIEKVAWVTATGTMPELESRQAFVWGSPNTHPMLVLLAVPFVLWLPQGLPRRIMAGLLMAAAVIVVPLSMGRAGWLGLAVAAIALEPLHGWPLSRAAASRLGWLRPGRVMATAALVLVLGCAALVTTMPAAVMANALGPRASIWAQSVALFGADPLTGSGPSTWSWARLQHVPDFADRVGVTYAHNVPLQTLADGGLMLGLALALVLGAWGAATWRRCHELDRAQRIAVAVLAGSAAASLLDDFSFLPAVTALVVTIAAWVVAYPTSPAPHPRIGARGLVLPLAVAALGLVSLPAAAGVATARLHSADARAASVAGSWDVAQRQFAAAAAHYPANPSYRLGHGLALYHLDRVEESREAYELARSLNVGDPRPWGALAALSADAATREALLEAAARRSNDAQYAYRLAKNLAADGSASDAAWYLAIAAVLEPRIHGVVGDPSDLVRDRLPAAVRLTGAAARGDPAEAIWNADLAAGAIPVGGPPSWHAVAAGNRGALDDAERWLDAARAQDPHAARTWEAVAAIARLRCDVAAEQRALSAIDKTRDRDPLEPAGSVRVTRNGIYGEPELGDYQPLAETAFPDLERWPLGLVDLPACDG
ncbi:MAG: O-antigen ligase family protein [Candidatus Limnocylindria bacterium]